MIVYNNLLGGVNLKKNILFSVIIPIYNAEKYLFDTINSVLTQDYSNIELILVDDGSTDNSFNIIKDNFLFDERVIYLKKENSGAALSRNYGLNFAHGDYIFFLDSDDVIENNMFSYLSNLIFDKQFDIYIFGFDNFCENNKSVIERTPNLNKDEFFDDDIRNNLIPYMITNLKDEIECNVHFSRMMIIRKKIIDKLKWEFLSERIYLSEDVISLLDLFYNVNSVKIINRIFYHYRVTNGSLTHNYSFSSFEKNNNLLLKLLDNNEYKYNNMYTERIIYLYFSYLIANLKLLAHSSLSFCKKMKYIKFIVIDEQVNQLIDKYLYLNDFKRRIFLSFIKRKCCFFIFILSFIK